MPEEPCAVLFRGLADTVVAVEPNDAPGEHDLAYELWAVGKERASGDGAIEVAGQQQGELGIDRHPAQAGCDESGRLATALPEWWVGADQVPSLSAACDGGR